MKKTYLISTFILLAIAFASCKKGFLSQEVNPNTPSVATPQQLLAGAEGTTAGYYNTFGTFAIWLGYYAPSGNYTVSSTTEGYQFTNSTFNYIGGIYPHITSYTVLQQQSTAPSLANFSAISKIMIAFEYQYLVDIYNDVPYTQAENSNTYLFPAYDSGQNVIYPGLLASLDAAIAQINANPGATNPSTSDIIFGGNMTSWKKFANTLKLRLAIRQSNIAAAQAGLKTELATTAGEGYLDDVTFATANPGYLSSDANGGQQSPFWKTFGYTAANIEAGSHATNRANVFFINFGLAHGGDSARIKQFYAPTNTPAELKKNPVPTPPSDMTHTVGNQFGNDNQYLTNANTSGMGPGLLLSPTMNAVIISGSQACFLQSEGIVLGLIPGTVTGGAGTAQDYYQRGITASFVALNVGGSATNAKAAAAAYYGQVGVIDVNWAASLAAPAPTGLAAGESNLQRAIATQKYIALAGYETLEEYVDYHRTALPDLLASVGTTGLTGNARSLFPGASGTGAVPNRLPYPASEGQTNAAAVAAEPAFTSFATGGANLIFWARNVNP